jgi:hypothetical protein
MDAPGAPESSTGWEYGAILLTLLFLVLVTQLGGALPAQVAWTGIGAAILVLVATLVHRIGTTHRVAGVAGWVPLVVLTEAAVLLAGAERIGFGTSFWSTVVWLPWLLVGLALVTQSSVEASGPAAPRWAGAAVALFAGLGVTGATWAAGSVTLAAGAFLATWVVCVPLWLHALPPTGGTWPAASTLELPSDHEASLGAGSPAPSPEAPPGRPVHG